MYYLINKIPQCKTNALSSESDSSRWSQLDVVVGFKIKYTLKASACWSISNVVCCRRIMCLFQPSSYNWSWYKLWLDYYIAWVSKHQQSKIFEEISVCRARSKESYDPRGNINTFNKHWILGMIKPVLTHRLVLESCNKQSEPATAII